MRRWLVAVTLFTLTAAAEEGSAEAKALVKQAIAYYKSHGKEATAQEVTKPGGSLRKGNLYVFIYDTNGTVVAHGQLANLVEPDIKDG